MARPFFLSTSQFRAQHIALYDFVHGTTAALWNTRWQVGGYLAAVPDASKEDIDSRFVRGSGIRGVNAKRTFVEQTWDEHREELARVALVNTVALYEGWLADLTKSFSGGNRARELQFPSIGVQGRKARGVRDALADMTKAVSPAMLSDITPILRAQTVYRGKELDELLLIYRYFKEARNALVHAGGLATAELVKTYGQMQAVTVTSARLTEIPQHTPPVLGQPQELSLRGVIGFGGVIFHIVATIDAELSQTKAAEREFVERFKQKHGVRDLPKTQPKRSRRVRSLTHKLGFPEPKSVQKIDDLLVTERLIR
jgi:hypothetical protein